MLQLRKDIKQFFLLQDNEKLFFKMRRREGKSKRKRGAFFLLI